MKKVFIAIICVAIIFIIGLQNFGGIVKNVEEQNSSNMVLLVDENMEYSTNNNIDWMLGVDSNYALMMQNLFLRWRYNLSPVIIFELFGDKGINAFRLRVWVKDSGISGLSYATETARWALDNDMKPCITLFLSDEWAAIDKQPAPKEWILDYNWDNISMNEKASIIKEYAKNTTQYFMDNGIDADIYEIGNEIDYGICGVYEEDLIKQENISWMRNTIWKNMSILINAAIEGVRSVDLTSSFVLHITHWWDYTFSYAFFKAMSDYEVQLDYLGLSFYPSSGIYNISDLYLGLVNATLSQQRFQTTTEKLFLSMGKPLIVSEYAYPSTDKIIGMFSFFDNEVDGYPLTPQGQKQWLKDFLAWCYEKPYISGTFYFSPEYYIYFWAPMALFNYWGKAKPAIDAFDEYQNAKFPKQ